MNGEADILHRELDQWAAGGATFWWRDDDLQRPTPASERMFTLAERHHAALAVAVIPDGMAAHLPAHVRGTGVHVLQHGFSHRDYAAPAAKKIELADHRPRAEVRRELAEGYHRLAAAFGDVFVPALVPPWNRIGTALVGELATLGYRGLSTFGARPTPAAAQGVVAVNTHADFIHWRGQREFIGARPLVAAMVAHLRGRRLGECDPAEPTGLLTHHLVFEEDSWAFLDDLLATMAAHPAVRWCTAAELWGASP